MKKWFYLSIAIVVLDQLSKLWASDYFSTHSVLELTPWLNFILAYNTGAAFSFLGDAGGWQRWFFSGLAGIVSIVLVVWIYRLPKTERWMPCTLSLVLGGAVGNLIDRVRYGHVVDFIDFHIDDWHVPLINFHFDHWHFATFNIADIAITIGAIMLFIDAIFFSDRDRVE